MNQGLGQEPPPQQINQRFEQVDADAVCEQCGTVNEEGTLLCKVCGHNLRDQRASRLAQGQAPEAFEGGVNRFRMLTGLLTVLGILLVVLAVLRISTIEAALVRFLTDAPETTTGDLWSGAGSEIYEGLRLQLDQYPASLGKIEMALEDPVKDTTYNGRYILLRPGLRAANRVMGEAHLSRRGDNFYFVAILRRSPIEIRGFATLEAMGEDGAVRAEVKNTAGAFLGAEKYVGFGYSEPLEDGGHAIYASSDSDDGKLYELIAFRVR